MNSETTSEAFFDAKYKSEADPWNFATDAYEQSRYCETLGVLAGRVFLRALEPGCSIGVLTEQLARFCGHVDAFDISATAVSKARNRCHHLDNVEIRHASLGDGIPGRSYDLIVLSEIGYYFSAAELSSLAQQVVCRLVPGGILLAVHWLGHSLDHQLSGDTVHAILGAVPGLQHSLSQRHLGFRLDQWTKHE
jgi:SAM-dependent methyltransferase